MKIKVLLIGILFTFPAAAMWGFRSHKPLTVSSENPAISLVQPAAGSVTRIPVEVILNGSAPQWVYVQVGNQAVPEPGLVSLLALATLVFAFRRQRV